MQVIKKVGAALAVAMLSGCGGKTMMVSDMSGMVAASPASPWLTVQGAGQTVVTLTGLDTKTKVQVAPDLDAVVQAQVRSALQPKYFTDLIINCRSLEVGVAAKTDDDAATTNANLDLSVSCRIVARGLVVSKGYRVRQSSPIDPAAPHFDTLMPVLIRGASNQLADQLWTDVVATGVKR